MIPNPGRISINGSVEHLRFSDFHRTGWPFWDANLLDICSSWEDSGTNTNKNWVVKPEGPYISVVVPLSCPVPILLVYVPRSLENTRRCALRP